MCLSLAKSLRHQRIGRRQRRMRHADEHRRIAEQRMLDLVAREDQQRMRRTQPGVEQALGQGPHRRPRLAVSQPAAIRHRPHGRRETRFPAVRAPSAPADRSSSAERERGLASSERRERRPRLFRRDRRLPHPRWAIARRIGHRLLPRHIVIQHNNIEGLESSHHFAGAYGRYDVIQHGRLGACASPWKPVRTGEMQAMRACSSEVHFIELEEHHPGLASVLDDQLDQQLERCDTLAEATPRL